MKIRIVKIDKFHAAKMNNYDNYVTIIAGDKSYKRL